MSSDAKIIIIIDIGQPISYFDYTVCTNSAITRNKLSDIDRDTILHQAIDYALDKIENGRHDFTHLGKIVSIQRIHLLTEYCAQWMSLLDIAFNELVIRIHTLIAYAFSQSCPQRISRTEEFPFTRHSLKDGILKLCSR